MLWPRATLSLLRSRKRSGVPPAGCATGVAHNPDTVASVASANGGRWYAVPLRIVPERGQISENSAKPPTKQRCDVLHDDVAGSKFANKSGVLCPEAAARAINSSTPAGRADVLAWKPAADDIGSNSICPEPIGGEPSNVGVAGNVRPSLSKDASGERFDLTERDGSHSGPLEPEAEPADPAEEVEDIHVSPRLDVGTLFVLSAVIAHLHAMSSALAICQKDRAISGAPTVSGHVQYGHRSPYHRRKNVLISYPRHRLQM